MDIIKQLFASFDQQESILFLAFLVGAFLIGFILAWLLWGGFARRYRKEAEALRSEADLAKAELHGFKERYDLREADVQKAKADLVDARNAMRMLKGERDEFQVQLEVADEKLERTQASIGSYQNTIDDLNNQLVGLKAKNRDLIEAVQGAGSTPEARLPEDQLHEMQNSYTATVNRLAIIEAKLARLESENQGLKTDMEALSAQPPLVSREPGTEEEATESVETAAAYIRQVVANELPPGHREAPDDLKLINGVGPFLENKLNELGVYTYQQVGNLTDPMIERLTTAIEFFPGRIKRDDWVGQARRLQTIKEENPAALDPVNVYPKNPEDLKVIEGIGPKIEGILKTAGISNWEDLSNTKVENLKLLLEQAGDRYRLHNPGSWPQQAQMAATGQWEMLKELQDYLIGGREKT